MTTRHVILTKAALTNALAGEPVCDTCAGRGRILARRRRDDRVCPTCVGKGIPPERVRWIPIRQPERRATGGW